VILLIFSVRAAAEPDYRLFYESCAVQASATQLASLVSTIEPLASVHDQLSDSVALLSRNFGVKPAVYAYDGQDSENALAIKTLPKLKGHRLTLRSDGGPQIEEYESPDGLILLGVDLYEKLISSDDRGLSVAIVLAHEFGHIVQYKHNLFFKLRKNVGWKGPELHADFLAGAYLGIFNRYVEDARVWNVGKHFQGLGDLKVESRAHHGTPRERVAAIEAGYSATWTGRARDIESVVRAATRFVHDNF